KDLERRRNFFFRYPIIKGQRRRSGGIPYVVFPTQRKLEIGPVLFIMQHRPCGSSLLQLQIGDSPGCVVARSVALDGTECPADTSLNTLAHVMGNQAPPARQQVNQPLESSFH